MKTFVPKQKHVQQKWYVVDATDQILGRLASRIAAVLRGKHKPIFTPHLDTGDFVVVVNAAKVKVTGKKTEQKRYYRYTGYPGGLRVEEYRKLIQERPERVLRHAVWGMLPHNSLGRKLLKKLKIYPGAEHPHQAQQPEPLAVDARQA
ncbi:MAG: 50S ribosomal protein L13 [candidate division KSB1 bacterium]|nr:50S ribosomal protein L13 [candidate division KSB1 bacterium]